MKIRFPHFAYEQNDGKCESTLISRNSHSLSFQVINFELKSASTMKSMENLKLKWNWILKHLNDHLMRWRIIWDHCRDFEKSIVYEKLVRDASLYDFFSWNSTQHSRNASHNKFIQIKSSFFAPHAIYDVWESEIYLLFFNCSFISLWLNWNNVWWRRSDSRKDRNKQKN